MKTRNKRNLKNKTKKFLYNPNNPKKSFDVYIDKKNIQLLMMLKKQ